MSKSHVLTAIFFLLSFAVGSAQTAESDSLFAIGVSLYQAGDYAEAIPLFAQCDSIDKATLPEGSNRRDYAAMWIASCFYLLGEAEMAQAISPSYYNVVPVDRCLTVESDSLGALAWAAWGEGDLQLAAQYAIQCAEIEKNVVGEQHIWYGNSAEAIALFYCAMGDYASAAEYEQIAQSIMGPVFWEDLVEIANSWHELSSSLSDNSYYTMALQLEEQVLAIREHVLGKGHSDCALSLNNLAYYDSSIGNYAEAVRLGTEATNIYEKVYGTGHPDYATSLNNLASYYSYGGNTSEAVRLGTEAMNIREEVLGKEHPDYATSLNNLASYYSDMGNYAEAVRLGTEAMNIREKVLGKEHPSYATSLNNLALYNSSMGNYAEAVRLGTEAMHICEDAYGKEHPNYALSLNNLADYNASLGNYAEAIRLGTEALNIQEKILGKEHPDYAQSLNNLALYNSSLGNYAEAIRLGTEAMNIREEVLGKEHPSYATSLNNLASLNSDLGNYAEAVRLGTEAMNIREKIYGKEHPEYAQSLSSLANYNASLGNYAEAIRLGTEAMNIREKTYGKEHPDYATSLNNLADYNSSLGNYVEAARLGTETINIREKVYGKEHPDYATSLNNLATYTSSLGNYAEAIRLGTEAMNIQEKILGKEHPDYALSLNNLAQYNSSLGNYAEAVRLGTEAMNIREKVYGKEHHQYATSLNNLAEYNAALGNYPEAIRLGTEAMNIREKVYGKEHPDYATSLNNLATYTFSLGNYTEAMRLGTEALNIREKVYGTEHPDYAQSLNNLAQYNSSLGNYAEAMRLGTEALNIREKVYGIEHPDYANSLNSIASINYSLGNYSEVLKLCTEAMNILEKAFGKEHPDYATLLSNLAFVYYRTGNSPMLDHYAVAFTSSATKVIRSAFAGLNAQGRATYWQKFQTAIECVVSGYAFGLPSDTLSANGYNAVLLSKGLLLNSEIEFTKLIQESGDEEALALFKDLQGRRIQIRKLIEKPIADRPLDVDSLSREADKVEQQLVERSKVYGDFTKNLVITWPQVQEKLGEGDAAVEFVSFRWNADSTMYIAYVLRKDWDCPRMIPLFEEKELEAVEGYDYYTTPSVSRLVWEPLEEALEGVDRVYFSPGGNLYNIAIESVPDHLDPAHIVSERRDYYRLSSTRELALIQDDYTWTEGAVYGGLDYNMGVGSLAADEAHYAQSSSDSQRERGVDLSYYYLGGEDFAEGIRSDRKSSGLLDSLPGTREEAEAIKAQLDDISVPSSLYTDDLGTEASFKALDGQRKSIIHIGTHGFFNTKETEYKDPTSLLMTSSQQTVRVEDDALSRSGLCMAGANNLLTNAEALPDSLDDGWLTALEIAHLDLRGLDMVVLSACKTGVGEVTGDGVFGLQRGFKKAGARTLVMSLWNVPDLLTCYFMKEFFARISVDKDGHPTNKHAAFLQAQQAARTHWQEVDPLAASYDWAAFILLDGVD